MVGEVELRDQLPKSMQDILIVLLVAPACYKLNLHDLGNELRSRTLQDDPVVHA